MTRRNGPRLLGDLLLSLAAVLGCLGILLVLAGATLGVRPLLFRSGSMAPTIGTGDLALARSVPSSALRIGDIVSVLDAGGHRVTHRVMAIQGTGATRELQLRGDANTVRDDAPYAVTSADRVFLVVHGAGRPIAFAAGPAGMFVLGLYVALLLALVLRGTSGSRKERRQRGRRSAPRRKVVAVGLAVVAAALPTGSADAAAWTDGATVSGQALTASTVPVPAGFACSGSVVGGITFNWATVSGATGYVVTFTGGSSSLLPAGTTSYTLPGSALGVLGSGDGSVHAVRAFPQTTWTSKESAGLHYTYLLGLFGALVAASC